MKALLKANAAGQRLYVVTSTNQVAVLPSINHDPSTMSEIQFALAAGKTVITHTDPVTVSGWSGAGYVILDSATGEAAWKIAGGSNGGFILMFAGLLLFFALAILGPAAGVALPFLIAGMMAGMAAFFLGMSWASEKPKERVFFCQIAVGALAVAIGTLFGALARAFGEGAEVVAYLLAMVVFSTELSVDYLEIDLCPP